LKNILESITRNREARRWTEYQLAEKSGLPQSTISSWYRKNMTPSFASLEKICQAFGLTLSQFFADGEELISVTQEDRILLERWSYLTAEQKQALLQLIDQM
jgi:transcriptional regulator with XRE-family HTH domain